MRFKYENSVKTSSSSFLSVILPAKDKSWDGSANICELAGNEHTQVDS